MISAIFSFFLFFAVPSPATAADALACFQSEAAARIAACTQAIDGDLNGDMRALALASRAEAFAATGDTAKALADYDAVLALTPGDLTAIMARAQLRQSMGDNAGAEADYTSALKIDGTLAEALSQRGDLHFIRGDFTAAVADYEAFARATAPTPHMILRLFITRGRAGISERESLTASATAIRARGWADAAWPMAMLRYFLGELSGDEALEAAQNEPRHLCEAYFILGEAGLLLDDNAEATKLFNGIIALNADCPFETAAAQAELARLTSP